MKQITKNKLKEAKKYCDKNNKSTEFMLQYMQDFANVDLNCVLNYLENKNNQTVEYTLQDILDAANYGYNYALTNMPENNNVIPNGNILQWLMNKKNLINTPKEFEQFKKQIK